MDKRIQKIVERWYLSEPAMFQIFLTHNLEPAEGLACPFRCGKGKIEYSPKIIEELDMNMLESYLKAEIIRILLKHPYERQPDGCSRHAMSMGSNLVLGDNYDFDDIGLSKPKDYNLPGSESYEWYSYRMEKLLQKDDDGNVSQGNNDADVQDEPNGQELYSEKVETDYQDGKVGYGNSKGQENPNDGNGNGIEDDACQGSMQLQLPDGSIFSLPGQPVEGKPTDRQDNKNEQRRKKSNGKKRGTEQLNPSQQSRQTSLKDLSALWEEDSLMSCTIDVSIDEIEASNSWGSLAGNIAQQIVANTKARIDYRKVLAGFRASVLSSKRHLTRMRPNRRSGFDNMGSIRRFDTDILVAVDVSGSISDKTLSHFYSIINRVFKYGIEHIDAVQFDTELKEVEPFDKAKKKINILGRGGTNFQPIFDFVDKHKEYDGLIIFTDGVAPVPKLPKRMNCKVVWVCNTKQQYESNCKWMRKIGRCCTMEI